MSLTRRTVIKAVFGAAAGVPFAGALRPGSALAAEGQQLPGADAATDGYVQSTLHRMSLEEKVGQLFVTYVYGGNADAVSEADATANRSRYGVATPAEVVRKYHLGGVIYFAWSHNVDEPQQIARLSNGLQRAALHDDRATPIPLLITTDQEQGVVARVGPPAAQFPGNMALGAGRRTDDAYDAAAITGAELRALGINQNFAPVADVNVNALNPVIGVRSFSSDPSLVATMVAAQVSGYQQAGEVAATAKHFPGHGDTTVDSHTGLPVIAHSREEWERIDAPPFQAAIDQGIDTVMTAHIVVPALDPSGDPATLSRPIITGLLRRQLRFRGVVVTDALGMQGVRDKYGDAEVPVRALLADVDQLLMPPNLDLAYEAVLDAVRSGRISLERLDRSVERVLRLKWTRGIVKSPLVDEDAVASLVGTPAHLARAQAVTDRTVTLVRDDAGRLPLTLTGASVLVTGWGETTTGTLAARLAARGAATHVVHTGLSPSDGAIASALAAAAEHDLTVVLTNKAWTSARQQLLVERLAATGSPVIVVAVRDPYDVAYLPTQVSFLTTYSYTGVAMESLARVLTGELAPTGKLPVDIPRAGEPGSILFPFGHGLSW